MSQKKVDEYKKYKKNRRENIRKEKRKNRLIAAGIWGFVVIFIACVGASLGVTMYNHYQAKLAALPTYGSTSFILSDMVGIQQEETEPERTAEEETEASSEEETEAVTEEETERVSEEETATEPAESESTED